jgi:hypothetical protein
MRLPVRKPDFAILRIVRVARSSPEIRGTLRGVTEAKGAAEGKGAGEDEEHYDDDAEFEPDESGDAHTTPLAPAASGTQAVAGPDPSSLTVDAQKLPVTSTAGLDTKASSTQPSALDSTSRGETASALPKTEAAPSVQTPALSSTGRADKPAGLDAKASSTRPSALAPDLTASLKSTARGGTTTPAPDSTASLKSTARGGTTTASALAKTQTPPAAPPEKPLAPASPAPEKANPASQPAPSLASPAQSKVGLCYLPGERIAH